MTVMRGPIDTEAAATRRSVSVLRHYANDLKKGMITDSDVPYQVATAASRIERMIALLADIRTADCENGITLPESIRVRFADFLEVPM